MIKAVIFDLNGIFIMSEKLGDRFERDFGISTSVFLPRLFEIMANVRLPKAKPAFSYWEPLFKEWGVSLSENEFWDYWFSGEKESSRMIEYAKLLKEKGIKIFVLSNNFKERATFYGHYPWMHDLVGKAYFSWQTGFIKPDKRAWKLVLYENNLKGEECIYFDDKVENVEASNQLGIKSFLFTTEDELEKIINNEINKNI